MKFPLYFQCSFNRPNLIYQVREKDTNVIQNIEEFIIKAYKNKPGIIYCCTIKECEDLKKKLAKLIKCDFYHGSMTDQKRSEV